MAKIAQIGQFALGEIVMSEQYTLSDHQDSVLSPGWMRAHNGWGFFGQRFYSKSEKWTPPSSSVPSLTVLDISIASVSGAIVGKIRTDVQKSIVQSVDFTIDEHGCADFVLKLTRLPDFPILPFSILSIAIDNTSYNWYSGEIAYKDEQGTQQEIYEFRGVGVREYLKTLRADTTYTAGQDVGEIIDDLVSTWVAPYAPIRYNASKIDQTTGVVIVNDIEISSHPLEKVFQTLADMAGFDWGVDGDNDFYFAEKSATALKTFFIGYDVQKFEPKLNLADLKNVITVQRQQGAAEGGAGWAVAGVYNDATSVKKYGRKELNYQIPGFFEDDEADVIGNALLEDRKEPKQSGSMSGLVLRSSSQYLSRGVYRFILPFGQFEHIYSDVDDETEWTKVGAGDLALSKETDAFVYGDGCLKLVFTSAKNDYITFSEDCNIGKIEKIRFFVKASRRGALLSVGVGYGDWTQNMVEVDIHVQSTFFNYDWDISDLDIDRINEIGFRVDADPTVETTIWIDKIEFVIAGHPYYNLRLNKAKYKISPREQSVNVDFGALPPKMETYLASLFATASELKFTQEIR
jgi:hypothetical protein